MKKVIQKVTSTNGNPIAYYIGDFEVDDEGNETEINQHHARMFHMNREVMVSRLEESNKELLRRYKYKYKLLPCLQELHSLFNGALEDHSLQEEVPERIEWLRYRSNSWVPYKIFGGEFDNNVKSLIDALINEYEVWKTGYKTST
jgi:hypothetical protein